MFLLGLFIGVPVGLLIYWLCWGKKQGDAVVEVTDSPAPVTEPEPVVTREQTIVLNESEAPVESAPVEIAEPAEPTPVKAKEPEEKVTPDDLKKINGIGPKISGLLNKAGIFTFQQLADAKLDTLEAILEEAGPRFQLADPDDWAKQARELAQQ